MVALRDNNDNNKRKKKERRTGKDTEEKRRNVAFKELKATPLERVDGGNRFPAWLLRIHRAENLGLPSRTTETGKERMNRKRDRLKEREREREKQQREEGQGICSSLAPVQRCCGHTIQVEKAKVSSHDMYAYVHRARRQGGRGSRGPSGKTGPLVLELVATAPRENGIFLLGSA